MELNIDCFFAVTPELLVTLEDLERKVFPSPLPVKTLASEMNERAGLVALVASTSEKICGYKVGFRHSPEVFYSWIGGVLPECRRHGIATRLMQRQHELLREQGYKYVRTSTKNRYREMLLLNIKCGFNVTGVEKKLREEEQSVLLEKEL